MLNNDKYFYFFCKSDLKAQSKMLMLKPEIFSVNECVLGWGGGLGRRTNGADTTCECCVRTLATYRELGRTTAFSFRIRKRRTQGLTAFLTPPLLCKNPSPFSVDQSTQP